MGGLVRAISGQKKETPFVFSSPPSQVDDQVEGDDPSVRRRRSRQGTIATSARGILKPGSLFPKRKSLLGE